MTTMLQEIVAQSMAFKIIMAVHINAMLRRRRRKKEKLQKVRRFDDALITCELLYVMYDKGLSVTFVLHILLT